MSVQSDIYDFFTPIEDAIASAFKLGGVTCYTPLGEQQLNEAAIADPDHAEQFQKKRPRVEIVLHPGASKGILVAQAGRRVTSGHLREKARAATLDVNLITEPDIVKHRAFVARILFLTDTLAHDANETKSLTNHFLQSIRCQGGSLSYNGEEGHYQTSLVFDVDFSVQETAWPALEIELAAAP